jgi:hypothetical protein
MLLIRRLIILDTKLMDSKTINIDEDKYKVIDTEITLFIYHESHSIKLKGFKLLNQPCTLRFLLKFPNGEYCRFMSENSYYGYQVDFLKMSFDRYLETIRYNRDWCFGFLFEYNDNPFMTILKSINKTDHERFIKLLLEYIKQGEENKDDIGKISKNTRKKLSQCTI